MHRLVLIDGNAILHRAFHALPAMTNSKGQPTNAVYGFISMLLTVINQLQPTHLAVAFDRPKPTFRKKLFKDYQSQRPEMDTQLVSQVALVHFALEAMQIPIYELDGYEADDVIGTIAKQCLSKKIDEAIVVTGDRDLLQLVNHKVKLFMPIKGLLEAKVFGEKEAEERMGVPPKQVADLKGLMGDASDNYPGVAGVGPKTAISLLKEFGSVENIYKELDKISAKGGSAFGRKNPGLVDKLTKGKENAFLSYKLATVVCDAPVEFDPQTAKRPNSFVNQKVIDAFGELEFKTLLKRLLKLDGKEFTEEKPEKKTKPVSDDQLGLF